MSYLPRTRGSYSLGNASVFDPGCFSAGIELKPIGSEVDLGFECGFEAWDALDRAGWGTLLTYNIRQSEVDGRWRHSQNGSDCSRCV